MLILSEQIAEFILEKQKRYFKLLKKDCYMPHELVNILGIPYPEAKRATYGAEKTEKGYSKIKIIINLMGGQLYAK